MGVKDYDLNPDNNTQINGINIAEGCPPSGINNAIRQLMADVKADSDAQNTAIEALETKAETPASAENLGPVKVGDGLTMGEDGTLSANLATAEAAGRVKASETAMAGAVPLGGADGSLGEDWLKKAMDAASDAKEAANKAQQTADISASLELKLTRSSAGQFTVTGCDPDRLLYISFEGGTGRAGLIIRCISGTTSNSQDLCIGIVSEITRNYVVPVKITNSTPIFSIDTWTSQTGWKLRCYQ